jgi:hypothetical protein
MTDTVTPLSTLATFVLAVTPLIAVFGVFAQIAG